MTLTEQEERLIDVIHAVDQANPMGVEGVTSAKLVDTLLQFADADLRYAMDAHERFLEESKRDRFVDLTYYRAPLHEDGNRYENGKQVLKRFAEESDIAEPENLAEEWIDDTEIPGPDKPIEEWTEEDHEEYRRILWDLAEDGCIDFAVKNLSCPPDAIETALQVLEEIRYSCGESADRRKLKNDFDTASANELLSLLRRRVRIDKESGQTLTN